jgi:hypothetical protein
MYLRFLFLESMKTSQLYLPQNQSSAARSQAGAAILCKPFLQLSYFPRQTRLSADSCETTHRISARARTIRGVEILSLPKTGAGFGGI